jgi:hypothetical protein
LALRKFQLANLNNKKLVHVKGEALHDYSIWRNTRQNNKYGSHINIGGTLEYDREGESMVYGDQLGMKD